MRLVGNAGYSRGCDYGARLPWPSIVLTRLSSTALAILHALLGHEPLRIQVSPYQRPCISAPAAAPASSALSFSLYRQSAAQGNVASLLSLGDAYFYGRGVEQDWVRSAAVYYEAYQVCGDTHITCMQARYQAWAGVLGVSRCTRRNALYAMNPGTSILAEVAGALCGRCACVMVRRYGMCASLE